jgi:hypothetical protein
VRMPAVLVGGKPHVAPFLAAGHLGDLVCAHSPVRKNSSSCISSVERPRSRCSSRLL